MPYVKKEVKAKFAPWVEPLVNFIMIRGVRKGELNYLITKLMMAALWTEAPFGYEKVSEVVAAARDAADEMKRRVLEPLEDEKIAENGDVYPPSAEWRKVH